MKLLVDIKDEKASFVLEVLKHFKYVKIKELIPRETEAEEETKKTKQTRARKPKP